MSAPSHTGNLLTHIRAGHGRIAARNPVLALLGALSFLVRRELYPRQFSLRKWPAGPMGRDPSSSERLYSSGLAGRRKSVWYTGTFSRYLDWRVLLIADAGTSGTCRWVPRIMGKSAPIGPRQKHLVRHVAVCAGGR